MGGGGYDNCHAWAQPVDRLDRLDHLDRLDRLEHSGMWHDHRIPRMPGRSTSDFHRPDKHCLEGGGGPAVMMPVPMKAPAVDERRQGSGDEVAPGGKEAGRGSWGSGGGGGWGRWCKGVWAVWA